MLYQIGRAPQLLLTVLFFLLFTSVSAQGRLSGKVVDRATQKPLAGISVTLQDTTIGTTTDSAGAFRFTDLAIKTYNILFTGVGFQPQTLFNIVIGTGNETIAGKVEDYMQEIKNEVHAKVEHLQAAGYPNTFDSK